VVLVLGLGLLLVHLWECRCPQAAVVDASASVSLGTMTAWQPTHA
jgi:hypothetical protein